MQVTDLMAIGLLVFLEGLLSLDNALALAVIARPLPPEQRRKALTYGIIGAFGFRILSLLFLQFILQATWLKLVGGGYLIWMAVAHFKEQLIPSSKPEKSLPTATNFWKTVALIELTDIAFSIDSILAAVAVSPKLWVVATGGILGIIMMRVASSLFIKLLDRYPMLEHTAYQLVGIVGVKLGMHALEEMTHGKAVAPADWFFWSLMALSIVWGLTWNERATRA